jgi:hypothetical protein
MQWLGIEPERTGTNFNLKLNLKRECHCQTGHWHGGTLAHWHSHVTLPAGCSPASGATDSATEAGSLPLALACSS